MSEKLKKLQDGDFAKMVVESGKPAVVDFWATWCEPCKRLDQVLEDIAEKYNGLISFYRVDVNESQQTINRYSIRSIPTLLFFHEGEIVDHVIGAVAREEIEKKIENILRYA